VVVQGDGKGTETVLGNLIYDPMVTLAGGAAGPGGIVGDPKFVNTTVGAVNAFHLQASSPARNAGTSTPVYQDQAGVARATESDIGAYEYTP
jgi:hypothetical protein